MPSIEISQGYYTSGYAATLAGDNSTANFSSTGILTDAFSNMNPFRGSIIRIMKGAIPTDFSTLVNSNSRTSDILVAFYRGNWGFADSFSITFTYDNSNHLITVGTPFVNAVASGTATWYWMLAGGLRNTPDIYQQSFGTVGITGSGADLEMNSTVITSGQPYKINNLKIQFPISWSY